jgi:hypothetical protein
MWQVTPQKEDTNLNILHHMCPITPQTKTAIVTLPCVPNQNKIMSAGNNKERRQIFFIWPTWSYLCYYVATQKEKIGFVGIRSKNVSYQLCHIDHYSKRSPLFCTHNSVLFKMELRVNIV